MFGFMFCENIINKILIENMYEGGDKIMQI